MRYIRILVVILFMASLGLCGAAKIRERAGEDPTKPVITNETGELEISTSYEESDLLEGLKAQDEKDGDLTDQIMVGNFSQFIEPGVCNLSYVVFDSSNQAATLTRRVKFTDYQSPEFSLSSPLVFAESREDNAMDYIRAGDQIDGDISSLVKLLDSSINYRTAGEYTIQVEVSNSFGDTDEARLPVHIVEASRLSTDIHLIQALVYVKKGRRIPPRKITWIMSKILTAIAGCGSGFHHLRVNTAEAGTYEVHYQTDGDTGRGETWLTVIVRGRRRDTR